MTTCFHMHGCCPLYWHTSLLLVPSSSRHNLQLYIYLSAACLIPQLGQTLHEGRILSTMVTLPGTGPGTQQMLHKYLWTKQIRIDKRINLKLSIFIDENSSTGIVLVPLWPTSSSYLNEVLESIVAQ